jgi:hypothetical protein
MIDGNTNADDDWDSEPVDVDGRDPERSPMPWGRPSVAGADAGFSTADP